MEGSSSIKKYNQGLDILRCVAMAMVVLCHMFQIVDGGVLGSFFCTYGKRGVQLFFVMSGYLNTASFISESETKNYYRKRVRRFFPSYWTALLIIIPVAYFYLENVPKDGTHLGWIRYIFGINQIIPTNEYYWHNLYGFWTIGSFLLFYLITPFVCKVVNCFWKSVVLIFGGVALQFANNIFYKMIRSKMDMDFSDEFIGATPFHEMYVFFIGVCIFWAIRESKEKSSIIIMLIIILAGIALEKDHYIFAAMTGLFILASDAIVIKNVLCSRVLKTVSKYSFSVYLVHLFVINLVKTFDFVSRGMGFLAISIVLIAILAVFVTDISELILKKLERSR